MAPPAVDTSRSQFLWVLVAIDLIFGAFWATAFLAWHFKYNASLGPPLFVATRMQALGLHLGGLGAGYVVIGLIWYKRHRLFIPLCALACVSLLFAAHWPIYAPQKVLIWLFLLRKTPQFHALLLHSAYVCGGASVAAIGATFGARPSPRKREPSGSHGSARWGDAATLVGTTGLLIGRDRRSKVMRYPGDGHLLTVAPTRSGKGISVVIPNLLSYNGPLVVTDPKGENYAVTGARRRAMGPPVHAFDPFNVAGGRAAYNPLDLIDVERDSANDNAWRLADMLVVGSHRRRRAVRNSYAGR